MAPTYSKPLRGDKASSRKDRYATPPAIGLARPKRSKHDSSEVKKFEIFTHPDDIENKQKHSVYVPMFGGGTPEECLCFMDKAKTVYVGQRMWEGPLRYNLMKQLLFGGALAAFNNKASELGAKTMVHFQKCVKAVVSQSFPHKALAYQKKWMRNAMQKPVDMTMREFITRVREINNYLSDFPPFEGEDQKLDEEELIEIAKNGSPVKWQNEIIRQDFDKNDPTLDEYVQFFDRLATSEGKTVTYAADNLRNIDDRIPRK